MVVRKAFLSRRVMGGLLIAFVGLLFIGLFKRGHAEIVSPLPDSQVEMTVEFNGAPHKLANGVVYRVHSDTQWEVVDQVFDPAEVARQWFREGETLLRVTDDGTQKFPVRVPLTEGFEDLPEGVAGLRKLIGPERGWSELTLQTPRAPKIPDYVRLRHEILNHESDFQDARVEPLAIAAHSGKLGLRCVCPPCPGSMICTKASLGSGLVYFIGGETLWYQAWYRVVGSQYPATLADFECSYTTSSPGPRICLSEDGSLEVELKALHKPRYRQPQSSRVQFPTDQWVCVTAAIDLHVDDGRVRVWQDQQLVLDARGSTLPFPSAILCNLEIGISAHTHRDQTAMLDVDDVRLSRTELPREAAAKR